jgi:hypothetical protein
MSHKLSEHFAEFEESIRLQLIRDRTNGHSMSDKYSIDYCYL